MQSSSSESRTLHQLQCKPPTRLQKIFRPLAQIFTAKEPSLHALKKYRKEVFKRAGVKLNDPDAGRKLRIPNANLKLPDTVSLHAEAAEKQRVKELREDREERERANEHSTSTSWSGFSDDVPYYLEFRQ